MVERVSSRASENEKVLCCSIAPPTCGRVRSGGVSSLHAATARQQPRASECFEESVRRSSVSALARVHACTPAACPLRRVKHAGRHLLQTASLGLPARVFPLPRALRSRSASCESVPSSLTTGHSWSQHFGSWENRKTWLVAFSPQHTTEVCKNGQSSPNKRKHRRFLEMHRAQAA